MTDGAHRERPGEREAAADPFGDVQTRAEARLLPRWVWPDTRLAYPPILAEGRRIGRCWDLRLARRILQAAAWVPDSWRASAPAWPDGALDGGEPGGAGGSGGAIGAVDQPTLFDAEVPAAGLDVRAEYLAQLEALALSRHPERLRLLLAAESAGGLAAAELRYTGMPFDRRRHDRLLTDLLGPRPAPGAKPAIMAQLARHVCDELGAPGLNLDSAADTVRALRRAGLAVTNTRSWQLKEIDHPAIEPLLRYKKLARLASANGWHWAETWVDGARFKPSYVVGGVVTGRWATDGGGAQQFPAELRGAIRADDGWCLVVADAAQLEPRVLAALAGDEAMAQAGAGRDLYAGIVAAGVAADRRHAKVGMLSAIYGGTAGGGGQALALLRRAYPAAIEFVERAAAAGEHGERVTTYLGRTSPPPSDRRLDAERAAYVEQDEDAMSRARRDARSWGRFTRNFVVQGSAAEWAECWLAALRRDLALLPRTDVPSLSPEPFARQAHIVYFLHDEIVVHAPAEQADDVARVVVEAAREASRLMFGSWPGTFPLHIAIGQDMASAEGHQ